MSQSTEVAAGSGFTFENFVAGRYLAALLTEAGAPGASGIVIAVALQQRQFGEPLDDIVVDFRTASGAKIRLSLQCKSSLTITSAKTNTDFHEIIEDSLKTLQKGDFRHDQDRYGAAVGSIASDSFNAVKSLCDIARADDTLAHFSARFAAGGNASRNVRKVRQAIANLLQKTLGASYSEDILFQFLKHFVLIRFDALHAGSVDNSEAINAVRPALATKANAQAPALWASLCTLAREEAGRSVQFSRASLVTRLDRVIVLARAPSLSADLDTLGQLAASWVRDIDDDVHGERLSRDQLAEALDLELARERFVQIRGLPGCGKSVLLRRRVEADLSRGPALFLKSDRLEGKSWATFAKAVGLSGASLTDLLVELDRNGSNILYIDGIDRIEKEHQGVAADVVRAIVNEPLLEDWRIVISLRDAGSEPLRTWLPDLFEKGRLGTVEVSLLTDDESAALAEARPELRPLLFGSDAVRQIVRRPFFAKVLSRALTGTRGASAFTPASEVDILENWWERGGFNATGVAAILRQRAIVDLAARRVRNLSHPILLADLTPATITEIDALITDGILQWTRSGHSVRFSHDIFFEWALFHRLADSAGWLEEIQVAGEPPMIGRVVELLSQSDFVFDRQWEQTLENIEACDLRSQWLRAWLLGPIFTHSFDPYKERYFAFVAKNQFRLLSKALVWFQAEKTVPNANILDGRLGNNTLTRDEIVRLADTLGWPSDYAAWGRLIALLLDHIAELPVAMLPDVVLVFEVWQNALGEVDNNLSSRLLSRCAQWLSEIETTPQSAHRDEQSDGKSSRWTQIDSDLGDFKDRLRALVFRGARIRPDLVATYLNELKSEIHRLNKVFKDIVIYSPFLMPNHVELLIEISLAHFREELPESRIRREEEERERRRQRRHLARTKPAHERTRQDDSILGEPFSILGSSFNSFAWENLAVDRDLGHYFPASPLRQPFHALFEMAPQHALRLVKDISNHAMQAWRQLHQLDPQRVFREPLPITLLFPWGTQNFWGTAREYVWFRGIWAPKPLACAYQAMERWALAQIDAGRPADEIIQEIVTDHDCVAALGIAVSVMLKSRVTSAVTLSLITAQRLWDYDLQRRTQEVSIRSANQIGWRGEADRLHFEAVKTLNDMPHRDAWLRDFIPAFLLGDDLSLADKARTDIAAFADHLPFEYEEQRRNQEIIVALEKRGSFNAEFAKQENVKTATVPGEDGAQVFYIDNPKARDPEVRKRLIASQEFQQVQILWFWAEKSLKADAIADGVDLGKALAFAKKLCDRTLFSSRGNRGAEQSLRQGAVAGCAAMVLKYRKQFKARDIAWAEKIVKRAADAPEVSDGLWSSMAIISWHPGISAAKAMAYQLRATKSVEDSKVVLLRLVGHPLDCVAMEALRQSLALWDIDPRFSWCALWEAVTLCQFRRVPEEAGDRTYDPVYIAAKRAVCAEAAIARYAQQEYWPDLPVMPPAWAKIERTTPDDLEESSSQGFEDEDIEALPSDWHEPDLLFDWNLGSDVLAEVPVDVIMANTNSRGRFLQFAQDLLSWVLQRIAPPWTKGRQGRSHNVGKLDSAVGHLFAKLAIELDTDAIERLFFAPVLSLTDEACYGLLTPFTTYYLCAAIYDRKVVPDNAVAVMMRCADRILQDRSFNFHAHGAGRMHGFDLPVMLRAAMLVYATDSPGATRFANGDWSELGMMMPIIDRIMRAAGWGWAVMSEYLTLVERSFAVFPSETFADQLLINLSGGRDRLKGWRGLNLPARIAGLVQSLASRDSPMPIEIAQKLLKVLDLLIDMGDRRSAALQISDPFRSVRRDAS